MPSPFPGMDPYLEAPDLWPSFQHALVSCLHEVLLPGLVDRYRALTGRRHYAAGADRPEEHYLEVVQRADGRSVTLVDVVSPANRTTAAGREAYLSTRQRARDAGASVVEVDLVLQGEPTLAYPREGLPAWDYAVTISRASAPDRYEIYATTLQKRLPRFRLPLAADDRDTVLDLQAIFSRCYDRGGFGGRIDYQIAPAWLHDRIAVAAYYLWLQEGRPHGRDGEHWRTAVEQLRKPAGAE